MRTIRLHNRVAVLMGISALMAALCTPAMAGGNNNYPPPPPPPPVCCSISSNFNGTPIQGGDYIWFNANFTASGAQDGTTINFTNSSITADGQKIPVPNSVITFTKYTSCTYSQFDKANNTWYTWVPVGGSDEIFLSGVAVKLPWSLPGGGITPTWSGEFTTNTPGVKVQWKWGAAVYTSWADNYNDAYILPGHGNSCLQGGGDHAGTPEGWSCMTGKPLCKGSDVGGATGGGAANCTGSWSGTETCVPQVVVPMCGGSPMPTTPTTPTTPSSSGSPS